MPARAQRLEEVFTRERIERLCGVRGFARASMIRSAAIEDLVVGPDRVSATVRGTMPYSVALWVEGTRKAAYSCTCPQGDDGKFCKHLGAVALRLQPDPKELPDDGDEDTDPVVDTLSAVDPRTLAELLVDAAVRDRRTAQRIESLLSPKGSSVDSKAWRKAITAAFGRPSHFVDYYEAPGWAERVNQVLADLRGLLDDGEATAVVPLVEYAFGRADKATGYVDSSDGWFIGIGDDIAELHLRACEMARPDPIELTARLVDFELHAELDTFRRAAQRYADVFGPEGVAEYRRLVQPAFDALGPASERFEVGTNRLGLIAAMLGVARAEGDVDEVVRIRATSLRTPHDYEEIVEVLAATGRLDEAKQWARAGLDMPGREHQMDGLRRQLVAVLRDEGDNEGAQALLVDAFQKRPSRTALDELLAQVPEAERAAVRADMLDGLRARAIETDSTVFGSVLVQILLHDGELDAAWESAITVGCDERWWMTVARARAREHPADAIPIYARDVAASIDKKDKRAYKSAVAMMARIEDLYGATGDELGWRRFLASVVDEHARKPSLMAQMREKGWVD